MEAPPALWLRVVTPSPLNTQPFTHDAVDAPECRRVTALHKANVCKQSDGLFLKTFQAVAAQHGVDLICDDQLADSCLTRLVQV